MTYRHDFDPSFGADDRHRAAEMAPPPALEETITDVGPPVSGFDPDTGRVPHDPPPARVVHLGPTPNTGEACTLSRCGEQAVYLIGWAPAGDQPREWSRYCARHGAPHTGIPAREAERLWRNTADEPF